MAPADKDALSGLRRQLGDAVGAPDYAILGWDLALVDTLPATVGGLDDAFVFAPRLDNQASCHAALMALIGVGASDATQVVCLYDHEEVGSLTAAGADGPLVELLLARLASGAAWSRRAEQSDAECVQRAIARSWHVSADMAHAVHPSYEDKHEPQHKPLLNGGPVIKSNANQRYATSGETAALFEALCQDVGVPVQKFVTRTDLACGSTIGPIAGGKLGVRTVDVGNPMLSMHSAREQGGAHDVAPMIKVLGRFLAL
jgi:aspartyl aminopeptidase